jgi:hypothetical protein
MIDNYDDPSIGGTNLLPAGSTYHMEWRPERTVDWTEEGLRITRFRMVSDRGFPFWDVTYCHGYIGDEQVEVELPFSQLKKFGFKFKRKDGTIGKGGWKAHLMAWGRKEGVNVWKLGIIENVSTLN